MRHLIQFREYPEDVFADVMDFPSKDAAVAFFNPYLTQSKSEGWQVQVFKEGFPFILPRPPKGFWHEGKFVKGYCLNRSTQEQWILITALP